MKTNLTMEDLKAQIEKVEYQRMGTKTTICLLTLKNGFEVVGQSAPVDVKNFEQSLGEKFAYDDAIAKVWQFEGYRLQAAINGKNKKH